MKRSIDNASNFTGTSLSYQSGESIGTAPHSSLDASEFTDGRPPMPVMTTPTIMTAPVADLAPRIFSPTDQVTEPASETNWAIRVSPTNAKEQADTPRSPIHVGYWPGLRKTREQEIIEKRFQIAQSGFASLSLGNFFNDIEIAALQGNNHLKKLELRNNNYKSHCGSTCSLQIKQIITQIAECLTTNASVKELEFVDCDSSEIIPILDALHKHPGLKQISLLMQAYSPSDELARSLLALFAANSNLEGLTFFSFDGNARWTHHALATLCKLPAVSGTLTSLELHGESFGNAHALSNLAEALRQNHTLKMLNFHCSQESGHELAAIAAAIRENTSLSFLQTVLTCNLGDHDEVEDPISENAKLINPSGEEQELPLPENIRLIFDQLQTFPNLTAIYINFEYIKPQRLSGKFFSEMLGAHPGLQIFELSSFLTITHFQTLCEAIACHPSLRKISLFVLPKLIDSLKYLLLNAPRVSKMEIWGHIFAENAKTIIEGLWGNTTVVDFENNCEFLYAATVNGDVEKNKEMEEGSWKRMAASLFSRKFEAEDSEYRKKKLKKFLESDSFVEKILECAGTFIRRRNRMIQTAPEFAANLSAMMRIGTSASTEMPELPVELYAELLKSVALHLLTDDAQNVFNAFSLTDDQAFS